jgi:aminopeptidase N
MNGPYSISSGTSGSWRPVRRLLPCVLIGTLFAAASLAHPLIAQSDPYDSGGPLMPEQAAYDVSYYDLELRVNPADSTIQGVATITTQVVAPIDQLVLDLDPRLAIQKVEAAGPGESTSLGFERRGGKVWISLPTKRKRGDSLAVRIAYGGRPRVAPRPPWDGGFTWARTSSGAPWIATSCFGEGADVWRPVKDHPSDEPDSTRLHVSVPEPLVVASNGRLEGVDRTTGARTYHWFVSTPINNYNVALNIAPYETLETSLKSVAGETFPVIFWVLPEHVAEGRRFLPEILDQLRFYERTLGPYPFRADKYGVAETPFLGMEHQTIIAYGAGFDRGAMTGGVDWGFDALHQHELSHEWWGNLVTNADFKDLWLHEGFGTYMQPLYLETLQGRRAYHAYLNSMLGGLENRMAVAPRESKTADQIYATRDIYTKGAWVLHTLRYLIGDEAFRTALRRMAYPRPELEAITDGRQTRFASTEDFLQIAEDVSGMELDWFFEVYLRRPELPELLVTRTRDGLALRWNVPGALPFPMPVPVTIGKRVRRVEMPNGSATLQLDSGADVVVDPDNWVLKQVGQ